jgi:uncharacterized protein YlxP (DUF503 family)
MLLRDLLEEPLDSTRFVARSIVERSQRKYSASLSFDA